MLDPVGVGAGSWRLARVAELLESGTPDIVRVNLAEAEALLGLGSAEQGVDSPGRTKTEHRLAAARALAAKLGCTVLLTGARDIVSDGARSAAISGGSELMPLVTGGGCMLSALCGAILAVEDDAFAAACAASLCWKRCSELAEQMSGRAGPGSLRASLMDAAMAMTDAALAAAAQPETL